MCAASKDTLVCVKTLIPSSGSEADSGCYGIGNRHTHCVNPIDVGLVGIAMSLRSSTNQNGGVTVDYAICKPTH